MYFPPDWVEQIFRESHMPNVWQDNRMLNVSMVSVNTLCPDWSSLFNSHGIRGWVTCGCDSPGAGGTSLPPNGLAPVISWNLEGKCQKIGSFAWLHGVSIRHLLVLFVPWLPHTAGHIPCTSPHTSCSSKAKEQLGKETSESLACHAIPVCLLWQWMIFWYIWARRELQQSCC